MDDEYELPVGKSERGFLAFAVAALVSGGMFGLSINGVDYVKVGAGGVALLVALLAGLVALRRRRFKTGGLAALVALGGAAMMAFSGVLALGGLGLGGLFGPSLEEVRARIAADQDLADVEVSDEGAGHYRFTGRRGFERCTGDYRVSGNGSNTFSRCGLPEDFPSLEAACEEGSEDACAIATERLHDAEPTDRAHLNRVTAQGCALGARVACFYSGVAHEYGRGREVDLSAALRDYRRGCEQGSSSSCANAGVLLFNGRGAEADRAGAAELWRQACDGGAIRACGMLGEIYRDGLGVERDEVRAQQLFQRACDEEDGVACTNLASFALRGVNADEEDPARAFALYERACGHGSMVGCRMTGRLLLEGRGVEADPVRALTLYGQACDGDDRLGCLDAGMLLHGGAEGVPQNPEGALTRFERGCALDDPDSCNNVGVYLRDGLAGPADAGGASARFERACELGHRDACREG